MVRYQDQTHSLQGESIDDDDLQFAAQKKRKRKPKSKEAAVLNMADLLYRRQDEFLTKAHQLHDAAIEPKQGFLLMHFLSAFRHAYVVVRSDLATADRKALDNAIGEAYSKVIDIINTKNVTLSQYRKVHYEVFGLLMRLYMAQRKAGMSIPKERLRDAESLLFEAGKR